MEKTNSDFDGLIRSLEDMEIAQKMLSLLLTYYPTTLIGLLADMESGGVGFANILEIAPNEPCNKSRALVFANDKKAANQMLKNLRISIQQFALNLAYEEGVKTLQEKGVLDVISDEPWFRIMTVLRNAMTHGACLEDKRHRLIHSNETTIEWNGISLSRDNIGKPVMERMLSDGALWKLIYKMRDAIGDVTAK